MKKYSLLLAIALVSGSLSLAAPTAFACSPIAGYPPSATENLALHDAAFIGTVQSVTQDAGDIGEYHITFAVNQSVKGSVPSTVTVATRSSSAACGYNDGTTVFAKGGVWAIYANVSDSGAYSSNSLSLNTKYASVAAARDGLTALGILSSTNSSDVPTTDLRVGSRGAFVIWLQNFLMTNVTGTAGTALKSVGATGYFGELTRAALAEFQASHGITPAQGYFGPKTRAVVSTDTTQTASTTLTGKLESVNTGCFTDGICSATVSGKKIILVSGGMRLEPAEPVGSIKGVDSIGDLENEIGSTVRVYAAQSHTDGYDYTLYGNSSYYLEVSQIGKTVSVTGTIGCRPPKSTSGPVIALCSFGLAATDGSYYALREEDSTTHAVTSYDSSEKVTVTGVLSAPPNDSFKADGTITVTTIERSK